jgi:uncharacterized membrane protein
MAKSKEFGRAAADGLPVTGEADRPWSTMAQQNRDYQRRLPPWLSRVLGRFPFLKRAPHPMLAHFPIVYMLAATFFSLLYLATGDQAFDDTAFYCLGAGVLFLVPAILTGLFTHWLNFSGEADKTIHIEKRLSAFLLAVGAGAFIWRWLNPQVLHDLSGVNLIYLLLVLAVTPLVTATSYFGGMLTFPLEEAGLKGNLRLTERKGKVG